MESTKLKNHTDKVITTPISFSNVGGSVVPDYRNVEPKEVVKVSNEAIDVAMNLGLDYVNRKADLSELPLGATAKVVDSKPKEEKEEPKAPAKPKSTSKARVVKAPKK